MPLLIAPILCRRAWRSVQLLAVATIAALAAPAAPAAAQSWGLIIGRSQSGVWTTFDNCGGAGTICGEGPHYGGSGMPFGLFMQRPVSRLFTFEPELLYSPKGSGEGSTPVINLRYIEVPLLIRITPPRSDSTFTRPYAAVGPGLGYLVNCELTENGSLGSSCSANNGEQRKSVEVSGTFAVGFEHRFADGPTLGVEFRYTRSLMSTGTTAGASTINYVTMFLLRWAP
jgi:hypothetical protein